jgi:outer membrane protein assembly factor BamB
MTHVSDRRTESPRAIAHALAIGILVPFTIAVVVTAAAEQVFSGARNPSGACGALNRACPDNGAITLRALLTAAALATLFSAPALLRRPRILALLGVLSVGGGLLVAHELSDARLGRHLSLRWSASFEGNDPPRAQGAWIDGRVLARVRSDRVSAYDGLTGAQRWTFIAPGHGVVCAMSREAGAHIGLLAFAPGRTSCGRLSAIDLNDGHLLWSANVSIGQNLSAGAADVLTAGAGLAVALTPSGLRAYDLRTGAPRWTTPPPSGCTPIRVAVSDGQFVAVDHCHANSYLAAGLSAATGRRTWSSPLPEHEAGSTAAFMSLAPLTLLQHRSGSDGRDTITSFDPAGHITSTVRVGRVPTPEGSMRLVTRWAFITGGAVLGVLQSFNNDNISFAYVAAFRPSGGLAWLKKLPDDQPDAVKMDGDRLLVAGHSDTGAYLKAIRVRDGRLSTIGQLPSRIVDEDATLLRLGSDLAILNAVGRRPSPPLALVRIG